MTDQRNQDIRKILLPVWAKRKSIAAVAFLAGIVVLAFSFLLPSYYRAEASLLPETENSPSSITQFADLAQLAGLQGGGGEIARLYPAILQSETVLRPVILQLYDSELFDEKVNLINYFGIEEETPEEDIAAALESLRDLLAVSLDNRTTIVTLTLEMREPEVAAAVLNAMIAELDHFMRVKRKSSASEQLEWITVRLAEVREQLQ
ncbi:MAG: Wzz/FepE/Etk N-terminal domain-containing protein, partial [Ignavibacteria bacterium]|nr:Wzz/FepE/Etk N-terminal domain-containing protein [Ignavibacteria bacterium]